MPELEGRPLAGSTIGIVGAGAIGRETIRRLEPFDVRVIASTRSGAAVRGATADARDARADRRARARPAQERSLGQGDLDELLVESDYVVLCASRCRPGTRSGASRGRSSRRTLPTRAQLDAALVRRVEQNVARFQAGEPLPGVIDPGSGY